MLKFLNMLKLVQSPVVIKANGQLNNIMMITPNKKVVIKVKKWLYLEVADNKNLSKSQTIKIMTSRIGHFTSKYKLHNF